VRAGLRRCIKRSLRTRVVGVLFGSSDAPDAPTIPKELIVKAHLTRATAVTMLLVLLGSAAAHAHERTASTSLTLDSNKTTVNQGGKVKFSGKLKSDWPKCRKWKRVTLYRDGAAVASTTTTKSGNYSFVKRVHATSDWYVAFAGKEWGQHPHVHVCLESTSPTIRIRVRGGGGGGGGGGDNNVVGGVAGAGDAVVVAGAGGSALAGEGSALTGTDIFGAARAVIVLGAVGLVALFVSRRRTRATTS
jgi:hypothetical protein